MIATTSLDRLIHRSAEIKRDLDTYSSESDLHSPLCRHTNQFYENYYRVDSRYQSESGTRLNSQVEHGFFSALLSQTKIHK